MEKVKLDYYGNSINDFSQYIEKLKLAEEQLQDKNGKYKNNLGWFDLPIVYDKLEIEKIEKAAEKIKKNSNILVIIGIGGSYLGSEAGLNLLRPYFKKDLEIIFAGTSFSSDYLKELLDYLSNKEFSLIVISKSGKTLETEVTFKYLKELLITKYGVEFSKERIYVITDKDNGILREMVNVENYESFIIPDDIGGRYSVLTAVGLLPMSCGGIDIEEVLKGSQAAYSDSLEDNISDNYFYQYALIRNHLYKNNKTIELFGSYEPAFKSFGSWHQQLFAESEGKEGKGIFPVPIIYSTDLHSLGQYVQEGSKNLFETIIKVEKTRQELIIKSDDNLNNKSFHQINRAALEGTLKAHLSVGVPNIIITIPEINAYYFGYLVYFFEKACALSASLLEVNPFNQPGVEFYKKEMLKILENNKKML